MDTDSSPSGWDPGQYNRFAGEREAPFWDLAALVEPVPAPAVVDLGCGDGRLTAALHDRLGARTTVGVDSSPAMLAECRAHERPGVRFEGGDLATWSGTGYDLVFSNAALHWAPDHATVLARWRAALAPGGQLAVQMPANSDHASHRVARELADGWLGAAAPPDPVAAHVLAPDAYAQLLEELGFVRQHVRLQVYGHHLSSSDEVVEWVKGSTLTRFTTVFEQPDYERFVAEYARLLQHELGDQSPYFYTFKRILLWGRIA